MAPVVNAERELAPGLSAAARRLTHGRRNPIAAWLDELGVFGLRAPEKRVPDASSASRPTGVAPFLRHLWATDGCIWSRNGSSAIYYATSSERLARDVQSLLLRIGVTATLTRVPHIWRPRPSSTSRLSGAPDMRRFVAASALSGERATAGGGVAIDRRRPRRREHEPRRASGARVGIARASRRAHGRGVTHARAAGRARHGLLRDDALSKANLGRERAARVAPRSCDRTSCGAWRTSDVYWDRIDGIEPDGEEEVFDLTVDRLHNFVANDVIVHNSIEQDADLVMFVYRDEYYDKESEREGIADLIISKHRNGGLGTVELTFQKEFPRFMSYAGDDRY